MKSNIQKFAEWMQLEEKEGTYPKYQDRINKILLGSDTKRYRAMSEFEKDIEIERLAGHILKIVTQRIRPRKSRRHRRGRRGKKSQKTESLGS